MYPKVVTVAQRKGGSAKTTTARFVAEYFARAGKKVLSFDLDNQCNLSMLLLNMEFDGDRVTAPMWPDFDPVNNPDDRSWGGRATSADFIRSGLCAPYDVTNPKRIEGWEIIPGDSDGLYKLEHDDDPRVRNAIVANLRHNIGELCQDYDLIVIDTGPSTNSLLLAAIRAATHVLIPFVAEPQCTKGLGEMLGLIRKENANRVSKYPEVEILGILPSKVNRQLAIHVGTLESMQAHPTYKKHLIPHWVPERVVFKEMDADKPTPSSIFEASTKRDLEAKESVLRVGEYLDAKLFGAQ